MSMGGPAFAEVIGGVEFPEGEASFADRVVSFELNDATGVEAPYDDPEAALGVPDYTNTSTPNFVSLGNAAVGSESSELILEFVDNRLIDVEGDDLYIFEAGPSVESTNVAVSEDGETWFELGAIQGDTRGVDLSNFSQVPQGALLRFVRLRDVAGSVTSAAPYGGPDIDAVGAIGSDVSDEDADGVHDAGDNCPADANTEQADADTDQVGDVCDACPDAFGDVQNAGCPNMAAGGAAGEGGAAGSPEVSAGTGAGGVEAGTTGTAAGGTDASGGSAGQGQLATTSGGASGTSDSGGAGSPAGGSGGSGNATVKDEAGCSCQLFANSSNSPFGALALLLGLLGLRRRALV